MFPPPPPHPAGRPPLEARQGPFFRYLIPAGWQIGEDGQHAVVLIPPDRKAISAYVGNVGLPLGYPPHHYLFERLMAFRPENPRLGQPTPARPLPGFTAAWSFELYYAIGGVPCVGVARCHVAPSYDSVTMVMTFAASEERQWPSYSGWLPDLPEATTPIHPGALGAQGLAQQNLQQSMAMGQQLADHRAWSQATWAQFTAERHQAQDRQAFEWGQAMAGSQRYDNPVTGQPIDLPATQQAYWIHPESGQIVGSPDPGFDPRSPSDPRWQRLTPTAPPGGWRGPVS